MTQEEKTRCFHVGMSGNCGQNCPIHGCSEDCPDVNEEEVDDD